MKFLADQNIRFRAVSALRDAGYDILHTSEIKFAETEDQTILKWAIQNNRTLITFDQGFGDQRQTILPKRHSGVIRLKLTPQKWEWVSECLQQFLKSTNESELKNRLIILYNNRVRIIIIACAFDRFSFSFWRARPLRTALPAAPSVPTLGTDAIQLFQQDIQIAGFVLAILSRSFGKEDHGFLVWVGHNLTFKVISN